MKIFPLIFLSVFLLSVQTAPSQNPPVNGRSIARRDSVVTQAYSLNELLSKRDELMSRDILTTLVKAQRIDATDLADLLKYTPDVDIVERGTWGRLRTADIGGLIGGGVRVFTNGREEIPTDYRGFDLNLLPVGGVESILIDPIFGTIHIRTRLSHKGSPITRGWAQFGGDRVNTAGVEFSKLMSPSTGVYLFGDFGNRETAIDFRKRVITGGIFRDSRRWRLSSSLSTYKSEGDPTAPQNGFPVEEKQDEHVSLSVQADVSPRGNVILSLGASIDRLDRELSGLLLPREDDVVRASFKGSLIWEKYLIDLEFLSRRRYVDDQNEDQKTAYKEHINRAQLNAHISFYEDIDVRLFGSIGRRTAFDLRADAGLVLNYRLRDGIKVAASLQRLSREPEFDELKWQRYEIALPPQSAELNRERHIVSTIKTALDFSMWSLFLAFSERRSEDLIELSDALLLSNLAGARISSFTGQLCIYPIHNVFAQVNYLFIDGKNRQTEGDLLHRPQSRIKALIEWKDRIYREKVGLGFLFGIRYRDTSSDYDPLIVGTPAVLGRGALMEIRGTLSLLRLTATFTLDNLLDVNQFIRFRHFQQKRSFRWGVYWELLN